MGYCILAEVKKKPGLRQKGVCMTMVSVYMHARCSQVHNSEVGVVRGGHRRLGATEGLHSPRIKSKCTTDLMGHQSIVPQ